jgi:hypothetical protein
MKLILGSMSMELHAHIQELEVRLFQREIRLDAASLEALLADDFVEFGASGNAWNKADVIAGLGNEIFVERSITDFKVRTLSDGVVLATYLCSSRSSTRDFDSISLRSSIWRRHADSWQMVFHQGTKVTPA